jgi:hypothetical protein
MINIRTIIPYTLVMILCVLAGCQQSSVTPATSEAAARLDSPSRLADYVRNEPAVRSVEVWDNGYGPGLLIKTAHYNVYTTLMEPLMLRQVPAYVESAYKAYQSQLPAPIVSNKRFDLYLFDSRAQWEAYTKNTMGADAELYLQIREGAYTAKGICVAYNIGRKQTFSIIGHEGWHQFNQQLFVYRLPSWLDEGVATLFETCRYDKGRFVFEPQRNLMRLGSLKESMQRGRLIPLSELLVLNPGQVIEGYGGDSGAILSFYAQNYALIRFLREYNYMVYFRQYQTLLAGGADGSWPLGQQFADHASDRSRHLTIGWNTAISTPLFTHYISENLPQMDAEYQSFCRKIAHSVRLKKR